MSKTSAVPAVKPATDDLLVIARRATEVATRSGSIRFGAPVSRTQVHAVREFMKGRQVLKFAGCTEKQLRAYASNEVSVAQLPEKTREQLRAVNGVYAKPWARKSAAILVALLEASKKRARKPAAKKPAKG